MRRTLALTVSILLIALTLIVIWISNRLDSLPATPEKIPAVPPTAAPPLRP